VAHYFIVGANIRFHYPPNFSTPTPTAFRFLSTCLTPSYGIIFPPWCAPPRKARRDWLRFNFAKGNVICSMRRVRRRRKSKHSLSVGEIFCKYTTLCRICGSTYAMWRLVKNESSFIIVHLSNCQHWHSFFCPQVIFTFIVPVTRLIEFRIPYRNTVLKII
jgi:hypothetical protein